MKVAVAISLERWPIIQTNLSNNNLKLMICLFYDLDRWPEYLTAQKDPEIS